MRASLTYSGAQELCRQDSARGEAERDAGRAADQVRPRRQPDHHQGAGADNPGIVPAACRRGDRLEVLLAAIAHSCFWQIVMAPNDLQRDRGKADRFSRQYRTKLGITFQSKQFGNYAPSRCLRAGGAGQRSAPQSRAACCTSTTLRSFCFRSKGLCPNSNLFLEHRNRASTGEVVALRS